MIEECTKRSLPAGAQRRYTQRALQGFTPMPRQVEQGVDLGDGHAFGSVGDLDDLIVCTYLSLLEHTQVEARPTVRYEQRRHPRLIHPHSEAVAGDPRLGDFEQRIPDAVAIANAHFAVGQAVDCEVFPELAKGELRPAKLV